MRGIKLGMREMREIRVKMRWMQVIGVGTPGIKMRLRGTWGMGVGMWQIRDEIKVMWKIKVRVLENQSEIWLFFNHWDSFVYLKNFIDLRFTSCAQFWIAFFNFMLEYFMWNKFLIRSWHKLAQNLSVKIRFVLLYAFVICKL